MNLIKVYISFIVVVMMLGCNKSEPQPSEPQLPPLTTNGEGVFACKLNGTIWVAKVDPSVWITDVYAAYFPNDSNRMAIEGVKEYEDEALEKITFTTYLDHGTGEYQMRAYPDPDDSKGYYFIGRPDCEYSHDYNNPGSIDIVHWDETNNIISGYFEMILINPDCSEDTLMSITEGRFDMNYTSWP